MWVNLNTTSNMLNISDSSCDKVITWNCLNCNNVEEHFHSNFISCPTRMTFVTSIC